MEPLAEEDLCPVCLGVLLQPIALPCPGRHKMCLCCVRRLLDLSLSSCPLCGRAEGSRLLTWSRRINGDLASVVDTDHWDRIQATYEVDCLIDSRRALEESRGNSSRSRDFAIAPEGEVGMELALEMKRLRDEFLSEEIGRIEKLISSRRLS